MNDPETRRQYYRMKNDLYAKEQGYKDWDDLYENSVFGKKKEE